MLNETIFQELETLQQLYANFKFQWATRLLPVDPAYVAHIEQKYGRAWADKVQPVRDTKVYTRGGPVPTPEVSAFERKWRVSIPESVRDFFLTHGEVHFDVDFTTGSFSVDRPEGQRRDFALSPKHTACHAQLDISLAEMERAEQRRRGCLHQLGEAQGQPWRDAVGFMLADNGDVIAVHPHTGKVIYLSCDSDSDHNGIVLGDTVAAYITSLLRIGALGKEIEALRAFLTPGKEGVDPDCLIATLFRYQIGLSPRPTGETPRENAGATVSESAEPALFKDWVMAEMKENMSPLFRANGYKKGRKNWFVRERNGVVQYVFFYITKQHASLYGGSVPVYLPDLSVVYDTLRLPPDKDWVLDNHAISGHYVSEDRFEYVITPEEAGKWTAAERIIRESILPQLDRITGLEDLLAAAHWDGWYGVRPYVEGVYECLRSDFNGGLQKLQQARSEMKDFHLKENDPLAVLRDTVNRFCHEVVDQNGGKEAFMKVYEQVCAQWRSWYKLQKQSLPEESDGTQSVSRL